MGKVATRLDVIVAMCRALSHRTAAKEQGWSARRPSTTPRARPLIVVTGPPRSGTSAIARVLHQSGLVMGTEFDPPGEANATGFFEDLSVRSVNSRILDGLTSSRMASRLPRWPWRSVVLGAARPYESEMSSLIAGASGGWKDPQFTFTLEAWLQHMPEPPKVVVCLRSPEEYVHSVMRQLGFIDRERLERRWATRLNRLLEVIGAYRLTATCVDYDELVEHPAEAVAALSSFVGHPLDAKFVEPGLRHHKYMVPMRHMTLYEQVRALDCRVSAGGAQPQRGASLNEEDSGEVVAYLDRMQSFESHVAAAKRRWADRGGLEDIEPSAETANELRKHSTDEPGRLLSAYSQAVVDAQSEFGLLLQPTAFGGYHEAMRIWLEQERAVAWLAQALGDAQWPDKALHTAEASAKAKERLRRERLRALRRSGPKE